MHSKGPAHKRTGFDAESTDPESARDRRERLRVSDLHHTVDRVLDKHGHPKKSK